MGTPAFAVPSFEAVFASEEVIAVVTQPDRPKGRGGQIVSSPVKVSASGKLLPILQPDRIKKDPHFADAIASLSPDLIVVVAFGQILPQVILAIPPLGCINLHASLLPRYRGAAPIQWAVIKGEVQTGVTTMQMDAGLDSGPVLLSHATSIAADETAEALSHRLSHVGARLLVETLCQLKAGQLNPMVQDHAKMTYVPMLKKEDGFVCWGAAAGTLFNQWRGVTPWPGMTTFYGGRRLKIVRLKVGEPRDRGGAPGAVMGFSEEGLEVAAGRGYIVIQGVQPEGKRAMSPAEFMAGHPISKGSFFKSYVDGGWI